ncbi:LysR family transcriptional regulator [Saccharibacillus kuerlensis]|uniref:LysR family transcriptional regulator n=1 Tax=Saccharibacillus kuerlensis TaxID=459527 RepID=A0ABQ2L462_9BACL|nr:LysR family transcriptional regulator [Saccharibacillus kuerlensis]GGO01365.1 LysR family transcriptional regulator [Saccharibacillus kuerlensis]
MTTHRYEAFLKTLETGSLTKAAAALGYTQSSISHMLNAMEKEWRLTLLIRDRSGIRLTSDGQRLLPYIRNVVQAHRELIDETANLQGLRSGLIRLATFTSAAVNWLPGLIQTFQQEHPGVDFELLHGHYTDIENWLDTGQADCGFQRLPVRADFESRFLAQDRLLVILPEHHPLAGEECFPVEALGEEPFLLLEEGTVNEIRGIFELHGIHPKVRFTARDDYTIISMVESGLGISILPELVLNRTPYRVVQKELSVPAYRRLGICLRSREDASPALQKFLEHVEAYPGFRTEASPDEKKPV